VLRSKPEKHEFGRGIDRAKRVDAYKIEVVFKDEVDLVISGFSKSVVSG
jgi:hypothetical protein